MQMYQVQMHNTTPVPLSQGSDHSLEKCKIKEFNTEQEAVDFAKSVRNNWNIVYVKKTGLDELVAEFHGDDMYVGDKRTRLREDE